MSNEVSSKDNEFDIGDHVLLVEKIATKRVPLRKKFIPLWMNSTQTTTGTALGYTKAVPIAYAKPGYGATILENIQDSGFDFKTINFEVDRLTIDSVEGEAGDKYIVFPKRKVI
jgi:hypothetical protein